MQQRNHYRPILGGLLLVVLFTPFYASAQLHSGLSPTYAPPSQANISTLLKAVNFADRVEVFEMNGLSVGRRVYQSESHHDLIALRASMKRIVPSPLCACAPSTIIKLYRLGKAMGEIEIMSGNVISFTSWTGDAQIVSTKPWFDWLDARGITLPRKEFYAESPPAKPSDSTH